MFHINKFSAALITAISRYVLFMTGFRITAFKSPDSRQSFALSHKTFLIKYTKEVY
jgi:hypothetical protein